LTSCRWVAAGLIACAALPLSAGDLLLTGADGDAVPALADALATAGHPTPGPDDTLIFLGKMILKESDLACRSLVFGAPGDTRDGRLYVTKGKVEVSGDIRLHRGLLQVHYSSELLWKGLLTVGARDQERAQLSLIHDNRAVNGGDMVLDGGNLRLRFLRLAQLETKHGPFVTLSGKLAFRPGALVQVDFEGETAFTTLSSGGDVLLVAARDVEGELPELKLNGILPDQSAFVTLAKTDAGLVLRFAR
jgi:hypothetical protein